MRKRDRLNYRREMLMELGVSERVVDSLDRLEGLLPRKLKFKVIPKLTYTTAGWFLVLKNVYNWKTMLWGGNLVPCSWNLYGDDVDEQVENVILLFGSGNEDHLDEDGGIGSVKLSLVQFQSLDELEMKCMLKGIA